MTEFVIFVVVMIVLSLITKARQQSTRRDGKPNARMQALMEKIQAQQGGNQPIQFQGQFTQAAGQGGQGRQGGQGGPPPAASGQTGTPPGSQQVAAALQQLMQSGRQPRRPGEWNAPGQAPQQSGALTPYPQAGVYQAPAQFQPAQYNQQYNQPQYGQMPYQPPAHRPQQNNLPTSTQDLDARVRDLMNANNEVGAIRLLSEERDLGILEAQAYARGLVTPQTSQAAPLDQSDDSGEPDEDGGRYVGSAAFAESIFNLEDPDENVWASGWVDTPEPDDRSDIEELWQTVSNAPRPGTTPPK
jgi:hypothetical protein